MRIRFLEISSLLLSTTIFCGRAYPQAGSQMPNSSCDVPLVVTRYNSASRQVEMVQGLTPEDLRLQLDGNPQKLGATVVDEGPKRVALVIDASSNVPADEWKLETNMAANLIANARPDDRFTLTLIGQGDIKGVDIELPASIVQQILHELADHRPASRENAENTYDALLAASVRLNPSAFGNSLFLFGHPDDSSSKASAQEVRDFILRNRLRFFAISFTDPLKGKLPPNFDLNKPLPQSVTFPDLTKISADTGYFFSFHSVEQLELPGQTALFENFLGDLYADIAAPYRLTIPTPASADEIKLEITTTRDSELGIHHDDIHYPHFVYSCAAQEP